MLILTMLSKVIARLYPSRQPAIAQVFKKELIAMVWFLISGIDAIL